jgi:hypothetical protein
MKKHTLGQIDDLATYLGSPTMPMIIVRIAQARLAYRTGMRAVTLHQTHVRRT